MVSNLSEMKLRLRQIQQESEKCLNVHNTVKIFLTWLGTSPSLIEISSWPSPALEASTLNVLKTPTTPSVMSVT